MRRVVVTGLGCVSALGNDVVTTWRALEEGYTGIRQRTVYPKANSELAATGPMASVDFDVVEALSETFNPKTISSVDRFANFAALATNEALADAGLIDQSSLLPEACIIYGSSNGGLATIDDSYDRLYNLKSRVLHPLTVPRLMGSAAVSHLSILFGIKGLSYGISSACASSAQAICEGMHLIRSGRAKVVIVGGSDASLTYGSLRSWQSLRAVSEDTCRPFSMGRDGTVLGEGAATLILEDEETALKRGAVPYVELCGAGATADASHITQPDAKSAAAAIRAAHEDSGISLSEPILISAHGTGTMLNDRSEANALRDVYGAALFNSKVIATKSSHGHMLSATGAIEALIAIVALVKQKAPAIQNHIAADPECDIPLVLAPEPIAFRAALSTSFAFGGLNCVLMVRLPSQDQQRRFDA